MRVVVSAPFPEAGEERRVGQRSREGPGEPSPYSWESEKKIADALAHGW